MAAECESAVAEADKNLNETKKDIENIKKGK